MYITLVRYKSLEGDLSKTIVEELNRLKRVVADVQPEGFIQAYLLRERKGESAILSIWLSRRHMRHFLETEEGKDATEIQAKLGEYATGNEEYEVTWQARYTGEGVLEQLGGYK